MSHMIRSIQKCYRKLQKIIKCVITCILSGNNNNNTINGALANLIKNSPYTELDHTCSHDIATS